MKLLTAIVFGLSLIGSAASAANLSVNITIGGHSTAHVDHVCTIQHTNVSGALNGIIRWGFHTNGDLYIDDGGGGTDYEILSDQAVGANETFEYTGKLVIVDEDHLCAAAASSANIDIIVSYLDITR